MWINVKTIIPTIENVDGGTFDVRDKTTKFDLGGLLEIGGSYKLKERFLLFTSIAYQQSFTSITNKDYFSNARVRNYSVTLSIGLRYALKKE